MEKIRFNTKRNGIERECYFIIYDGYGPTAMGEFRWSDTGSLIVFDTLLNTLDDFVGIQ